MFDALPASFTAAAPSRARSITFALILHAVLIVVAVTSTASSGMSAPEMARDTIRVDLAIAEQPPRGAPPKAPAPAMPPAPTLPNSPTTAPTVELPQLDFHGPLTAVGPVADLPASPYPWAPAVLDSQPSHFRSSDVDELPQLLTDLRPEYPHVLRTAGVSGAVEVEYVVGKDGRIDLASLRVRATDHDLFTASVVEALRTARFKPARRVGQSVAVLVRQTIRFRSEMP